MDREEDSRREREEKRVKYISDHWDLGFDEEETEREKENDHERRKTD
jgi:hypothetical protein